MCYTNTNTNTNSLEEDKHMKYELTNNKSIAQYDSINEFYKYLCDTPFNEPFRWERHSSVDGSYNFTRTHNFEAAVELMKDGWSDMAKKLNAKLQIKEKQNAMVNKRKMVNSVAGFQPIVPLYLAGVPTNMVSQKMVPVKQKIVNITKSVSYSASVSTETIIEESIKAMQIVKKLEAMGYRVNLSVALGSKESDREVYAKVCIKHANEKLNISKLAFPLVHPSMLRRLFFRYIEVCPDVTRSFVPGYGKPIEGSNLKKVFPDEIILPARFAGNIENIHSLEDLIRENKL